MIKLRSAINRVKNLTPWLLTTGDDEGVIKVTYLLPFHRVLSRSSLTVMGSTPEGDRPDIHSSF